MVMNMRQFLAARQRLWIAVSVVFFVVVLAVFGRSFKDARGVSPMKQTPKPHAEGKTSSSFLHLVIPAPFSDVDLCRTVLSAAAAGYPTPVLPNWGDEFTDWKLLNGGEHLGKLRGTLAWLESFRRPARDDDLVIIVDREDVWFQLRPETLIERYHEINRRAMQRTRKQLGAVVEKEGIRQTIVFGAQKRCLPFQDDDIPCYAVPESPLAEGTYGTSGSEGRDADEATLPRWLNSGFIMGPLSEVRRLHHRVNAKIVANRNDFGSSQKLFALVYGEQEYQREVLRRRHRSWLQRHFLDWLSPTPSFLDDTTGNKTHMPHYHASTYDFGISLDYDGLLAHNTLFSASDSAWVNYSSPHDLLGLDALNITSPHPIGSSRLQALPSDILHSRAPALLHPALPASWPEAPLYTDLYTGAVPALVHHNAHGPRDDTTRAAAWAHMWFHPAARGVLRAATLAPVAPVAVTRDATGGVRRWWSANELKGGALGNGNHWIGWAGMCRGYEKWVFGDAEGKWVDPLQDVSWALRESKGLKDL